MPSIEYVIYVAATAEQVWAGLTEPELTRQYWDEEMKSDWTVGSPIEAIGTDGSPHWEGEIVEHRRPHVLEYATHDPGSTEHATNMRFELSELDVTEVSAPPVVRLTVRHDGFPAADAFYDGCRSTWPKLMSGLKSILEGGRSPGFVWQMPT